MDGIGALDVALDVDAIREHFVFHERGRIVTNNAASTQPPRALVDLYRSLAPDYENVHRGQSVASQTMTRMFESSYDDIAAFINAPGRASVVAYRNTTEAINAVMYSLMTELRDGDNIVTTLMEHNSNYVPWYALCREILPRFGVQVEYRLARFDPWTGELDLEHLGSLVDSRTKLVCCTGASNFLGTKPPLEAVREIADGSDYPQPNGERRSLLLVDAAQLVPGAPVDVQALDVDFLAFSFHKMLAPFGIGVLYAKEHLLRSARPFLYGGDMIAEGNVTAECVEYAALPWKYTAGTPNILGTIVSAQAIRLLLDLALTPRERRFFMSDDAIEWPVVERAMGRVMNHTTSLTHTALSQLDGVPGLRVCGPSEAARRTALVAFTVDDRDPIEIAERLAAVGVEARGGCHCATLAHHHLGIPASCRLSFAIYNSVDDVEVATHALAEVVTGR